MTDPLDRVLRLVAEGRLTAEEAAPILEALERQSGVGFTNADGSTTTTDPEAAEPGRAPRFARVEVRESGRRVVDLRVPLSLGRFALSRVPGLSSQHIAEMEEAVISGVRGPIFDVEDRDGDGVRIVLE